MIYSVEYVYWSNELLIPEYSSWFVRFSGLLRGEFSIIKMIIEWWVKASNHLPSSPKLFEYTFRQIFVFRQILFQHGGQDFLNGIYQIFRASVRAFLWVSFAFSGKKVSIEWKIRQDIDLRSSSQSSCFQSPVQRLFSPTTTYLTDSDSSILPSLPLSQRGWWLSSTFANLDHDPPLWSTVDEQ